VFTVKYPDGALFKRLTYGSLKPLSEVPLSVTSDSFLIRALSPDKNLLVEVYIPSTAFETYDVTSDTLLTLDRDEFSKTVRKGTKRDTVTLRYEDGARHLVFTLTNTKTGAERTYQITVLETGRELIQSLNLDLPVRMQMESKNFKKVIADAKIIGDELEISYNSGEVTVKSVSEGRMFEEKLSLDRPLLSLESREDTASSKYDLDLLKSIASTLEAADVVTIEFGTGLPMRVTLATEDGAKVTFWIAPRT